jgi:outer membrane protein OmpA-like peptidoglycan-associated protein
MRRRVAVSAALIGATGFIASPARTPIVPLCPGLTIVTAAADKKGDYESIKQVKSVSGDTVRLHYSADRVTSDTLGELAQHIQVDRVLRIVDLTDAHAYLQEFGPWLPELDAGTTAIGTSSQVLAELKTKGQTSFLVFLPFFGPVPNNPLEHVAGDLDFRLPGTIKRVEPAPVQVPIIVNDHLVSLPAIHATGLMVVQQGDFYFLDEPTNPLTLKFTIGKRELNVVKIAFPPCTPFDPSGSSPGGGRTGSAGAANMGMGDAPPSNVAPQIEKALAEQGRAEVYGIYFDFASAAIRAESEPVLRDIADVLSRKPAWKIDVEGHTDSIGGAEYNLDLSKRRAAAVKDALVTRYHVAAGRLAPAGFGDTRPKDTNATLAGRARNRRVELVRQ